MSYTKEQFPDIYKHTKDNELDILQSKKCACLSCMQTYNARKINEWTTDKNHHMNAVCPLCGVDAVVGDASGYVLNLTDIRELHEAYYGEEYMKEHPDSVNRYVLSYRQGKIPHNLFSESIYLQYLEFQAFMGNADAAFFIGELFEYGTETIRPNLQEATFWYASPSLRFDDEALTHLGIINEKTGSYSLAYDDYAKAMSLGSLFGLLHFSDCYMNGHGVRSDKPFACKVLLEAFAESYTRFTMGDTNEAGPFSSLCYRLAKAYEKGYGVEKDKMEALRLYLYANYGFSLLKNGNSLRGELLTESKSVSRKLSAIAKEESFQKGEPLFDLDTFLTSLVPYGGRRDVFDLFLPYIVHPGDFDKENQTFSLTISYPRAPLIVDIPNLFCGFVEGDITWNFDDVVNVSGFQEGKVYNRIVGDGEKKISFLNTFNNSSEIVGEICFDHTIQTEINGSKKA
ncbi:MAG TPA: hypothetical protein DD384_05680 [Firmicutes bacterium]|nr:hypothetical protein [Bacillota bacterium]